MGKEKIVNVRLREVLTQKNISMRSLASHINVSYQQVSKYCNGSNEPSLSALKQITEFLNCSVTDIYPDITLQNGFKQKDKPNSTTITENHYHSYHNQSFLGKLMQMDPHLLRNQIVFFTVAIGGIFRLIYGYSYPTLIHLFNTGDILALYKNAYYYAHLGSVILAIVLMIVYTMTFKTTVLSYIVSIIALNGLVFQIYYVFFGIVGESEIKRTMLRGLAIIFAIVWVRIATKIRNKV